jgi:hypothetical protein
MTNCPGFKAVTLCLGEKPKPLNSYKKRELPPPLKLHIT